MIKILLLALFVFAFAFDSQVISKSAQDATVAFWTKEKMMSAVPMETLVSQTPGLFTSLPSDIEKHFQDGAAAIADTEPVRPESLYQAHPYKTIGKLFFKFQGRPAYCSGSSIGNNAVLTAGHCLWLQGNFHTDFLFAPQFNNGSRPVGTFVGKETMVFEEWKDGNFARDLAFLIVSPQGEKSLQQVVGRMHFGACDVNENIQAFGYPGLPEPFNGEKMIRTKSDIGRRFPFSPWEPAPIGIRSKQGPGSSGGPWIMKFQEPVMRNGKIHMEDKNVACSVNSFGVRFTYYVFGPFSDAAAIEMHKVAVSK
jgi:V8-like Glu-specific endopeptidase